MEVKSSEKYRYCQISENVIMFMKNDSIGQEIYDTVEKIVDNTANTWQKGRTREEMYHDTLQGKLAEDMYADFIKFYQPEQTILYLSYDDFREDGFEKHAPIDGILYLSGNKWLQNGLNIINNDVQNNQYGKVSPNTLSYLKSKGLYTVEVKSSRVPDKDYNGISKQAFRKAHQQQQLISNLRKRDFFVYPEFSRTIGKKVHNFNDYCKYVVEYHSQFAGLSKQELIREIVIKELETKCDIYTRIFMDWNTTESIIGYITGYALGTDFFIEPRIINMSRKDKSENALYYVFPIESCRNLLDIFNDNRLW